MWTDIVVAVSNVILALAAMGALFTWRKAMVGKAKFDSARALAFLVYKVSSDFRWARFPLSSSVEAGSRPKSAAETAAETTVLDECYTRQQRLVPLREDLSKLEEARWEAEVVLGKDAADCISEPLGGYRQAFGELASAVNSYFDIRLLQAQKQAVNIDQEWLAGLRRIVYSNGADDDVFVRLEKAQSQLLDCLRAYLR